MSLKKEYLGDGVYADHDGYHIVLTTENGISTTNIILLEPQVYEALVKYMGKVMSSGRSPYYKILDKNGIELPNPGVAEPTYERVKKVLDRLNKNGELRPYVMVPLG